MWRRVQHLDRRLMRRSLDTRSPTLDRTLIAITRAANYSRLWLVLAGALALCDGRRGRRAAKRGLTAIAIGSSRLAVVLAMAMFVLVVDVVDERVDLGGGPMICTRLVGVVSAHCYP